MSSKSMKQSASGAFGKPGKNMKGPSNRKHRHKGFTQKKDLKEGE